MNAATATLADIIRSRRLASTCTDAEISSVARGVEFFDATAAGLDYDSAVWWTCNCGTYIERVKKLTPTIPARVISTISPVAIVRCCVCGDTNIRGASFTTCPADMICDNCA
jgi:hypothetical protein